MPEKVEVQQKKLKPLDVEEIRCGRCGRFLTEIVLQPGSAQRLKCHCNATIFVFVVSVGENEHDTR